MLKDKAQLNSMENPMCLSKILVCCVVFVKHGSGSFSLLLSWCLSGERVCLPMQESQEMPAQSLGFGEDPLEQKVTTHSSTHAWRIPWTEESGRLQSIGSQRVRHN